MPVSITVSKVAIDYGDEQAAHEGAGRLASGAMTSEPRFHMHMPCIGRGVVCTGRKGNGVSAAMEASE
jgi:hypothetical protein